MKLGALTILTRTSSHSTFSLASWHSTHSLTWRWALHLTRHVLSIAPVLHASRMGTAVGLGNLIKFVTYRTNGGWQFSGSLLWLELSFNQQRPMWYRDLYMRHRDQELEADFATQVPPPAPRLPQFHAALSEATNDR